MDSSTRDGTGDLPATLVAQGEPSTPIVEATESALVRLLRITEILELVFLQMPPADILVNVQRTCKHWRDIVIHSKDLRQALFFEPVEVPPVRYRRFSTFGGYPFDARWATEDSQSPMAMFVSPFFFQLKYHFKANNRKALWHHAASWQQMLLTQPPISEIWIKQRDPNSHGYEREAWTGWETRFHCDGRLLTTNDLRKAHRHALTDIIGTTKMGWTKLSEFNWRKGSAAGFLHLVKAPLQYISEVSH